MKPARFIQEAQDEFLEQVAYYEGLQQGLGTRFRQSIEEATGLASARPLLGSPWKQGTRRVFAKGFEFALVYRVEPAGIVVLAVAHFRRKPAYWRSRK